MKFIAHRGNWKGPEPEKENHPDFIKSAIKLGFDVEIDLWYVQELSQSKLFLGHDQPQYQIDLDFLIKNSTFLWIHTKNIQALKFLILHNQHQQFNFFFHDQDDCVLTSKNYIWTYPEKPITNISIAVLPEITNPNYDFSQAYAVCSDYIENYQKDLHFRVNNI